MSETVIKIENLKKQYRLGTIGGGTLRADIQSWWARKRGKEDPNTIIGTDVSSMGETFYALDGISLEVKKGEALGIIGANGAGKSTLLKILSRVTAPTEGTIKINGRIASMLEVGTGFHPELTGRENIYMNGAILGMTKAEIDSKIEDIIDFSECRQFIDTPVKRYSSGMYVKLAFSVAAHLDAEIMIMDEVLAVGDIAFQKKCLTKMGDEAHGGKTVLYVSHNMSTIRNFCTRCIVLKKGVVIFDGDVERAISTYINVASQLKKVFYNHADLIWPNKAARLGEKGRILSVEFLKKIEAFYDSDEKMILKVEYSIQKYNRYLQMGFQLYEEDQTTIGFGACKLEEVQEIGDYTSVFEFNLSSLAEGTYCFRLNLHVSEEYKKYTESYDQTNFLYFDVIDNQNKMIWRRDWWNSVRLNEFRKYVP